MKNAPNIWNILENPVIYRLSQALLAPGAEESVMVEVRSWIHPSLQIKRNLDIGAGPKSLLWQINLRPIGLDPVHAYNLRFKDKGEPAITGTAIALPFLDSSFDNVWNFGLLHHLSDAQAGQAVSEMMRVIRPEGWVVIFDGVMPRSLWRRPLMWILRKMDRGRYMRDQKTLESFLLDREHWLVKRFQYCIWGHEGMLCVYQKRKNGYGS